MLIKTRRIIYSALIITLVIVIGGIVYFNFVYAPKCQNYECWQKYMIKCSKASFINEEPEASWRYSIQGSEDRQCNIEVELLLAKKGELGIEKFVGHKMTCSSALGSAAYVEKDLSKCHGLLKEGLQTLIINKLHAYIIENLGKINQSLQKAIYT